MKTTRELMLEARTKGIVIPAFNIPYLPMMEPVVQALKETDCFGLIAVARLEWMKFHARGVGPVRETYEKVKDPRLTRLHLDHVPVIDEDDRRVDYLAVLKEALDLGYDSVMVDGSRLPLDANIAATRKAAELAHAAGKPIEAELGAVMGHESGPLPPYEELFRTGKGFTDPDEARRFVSQTGADWLSVAIGNVHGAISAAAKSQKKISARLNLNHLEKIAEAANVPLVLHGGSGIPAELVRSAIPKGITKINIGTAIRQPYEAAIKTSPGEAAEAVRAATVSVIRNELAAERTAAILRPEA